MKKPIFCIMGQTCSGKDSLVRSLCDLDSRLSSVVSYTDRPVRDGEEEGKEHYFVTTEEFSKLKEENKDNIVAYVYIGNKEKNNGHNYMAFVDELDRHNIYVIDPIGYKNLMDRLSEMGRIGEYILIPIVIECPYEQRKKRAEKTRSDYDKFEQRCSNENKMFKDFEKRKSGYYIDNSDGNFQKSIRAIQRMIDLYL